MSENNAGGEFFRVVVSSLVWRSKPTGRNVILWKGRRKALLRVILGLVVNVVFRRLMLMRNEKTKCYSS